MNVMNLDQINEEESSLSVSAISIRQDDSLLNSSKESRNFNHTPASMTMRIEDGNVVRS
jgi:hypothetical protein